MAQTIYSRFKDYNKTFNITSSELVFPPNIYDEIIRITKGTILDIGTADGYKLENILQGIDLKQVSRVLALDPSPLYQKAKERFNEYKNVEVLNLCFEDLITEEKFNTILMYEVIEHSDNPQNLLNKITTLLKPNGVLICSTPNKLIYHTTEKIIGKKIDSTHVNEMTHKQFISLMDSYFHETTYMGVLPFMVLGRKFPKLLILNRYFSFIPVSRTIYCFARKPRV